MLNKLTLTFVTICAFLSASAQELNCKISVNTDQIQLSNKRIFQTLETAITQFVNERKWTNDNFKPEERIECSILLNITKYTQPDRFEGNIQISSSRPGFKSNYSSTILNTRDNDFKFTYLDNAPIEFTQNQYRGELSSILAYYVYLIIGLDYDSFELQGGEDYLSEAQRVVNNAQSSPESGWKSFESIKNRFWIVDNYLQQSFSPLRTCMYQYHRQGIDLMYSDPETARKNILEALEGLQKVHQIKPLSYNVQLFFLAKYQEIIEIFKPAEAAQKKQLVDVLKIIDPTHADDYQTIL